MYIYTFVIIKITVSLSGISD